LGETPGGSAQKDARIVCGEAKAFLGRIRRHLLDRALPPRSYGTGGRRAA